MELEDYLDIRDDLCSIHIKGTNVGLERIVARYHAGFAVWRYGGTFLI